MQQLFLVFGTKKSCLICCRIGLDMPLICYRYVADMLPIRCRYATDTLPIRCRYFLKNPQIATFLRGLIKSKLRSRPDWTIYIYTSTVIVLNILIKIKIYIVQNKSKSGMIAQ